MAQMARPQAWQAPAMPTEKKITTVDAEILAKVVSINPHLAGNRSISQLKKDLEYGRHSITPAPAAQAPAQDKGAQLASTLGFFIGSKTQELEGKLAAIATQKKALEEQERAIKAQAKSELGSLLGLLDSKVVATYAPAVMAQHGSFLKLLGSDIREMFR